MRTLRGPRMSPRVVWLRGDGSPFVSAPICAVFAVSCPIIPFVLAGHMYLSNGTFRSNSVSCFARRERQRVHKSSQTAKTVFPPKRLAQGRCSSLRALAKARILQYGLRCSRKFFWRVRHNEQVGSFATDRLRWAAGHYNRYSGNQCFQDFV